MQSNDNKWVFLGVVVVVLIGVAMFMYYGNVQRPAVSLNTSGAYYDDGGDFDADVCNGVKEKFAAAYAGASTDAQKDAVIAQFRSDLETACGKDGVDSGLCLAYEARAEAIAGEGRTTEMSTLVALEKANKQCKGGISRFIPKGSEEEAY